MHLAYLRDFKERDFSFVQFKCHAVLALKENWHEMEKWGENFNIHMHVITMQNISHHFSILGYFWCLLELSCLRGLDFNIYLVTKFIHIYNIFNIQQAKYHSIRNYQMKFVHIFNIINNDNNNFNYNPNEITMFIYFLTTHSCVSIN